MPPVRYPLRDEIENLDSLRGSWIRDMIGLDRMRFMR